MSSLKLTPQTISLEDGTVVDHVLLTGDSIKAKVSLPNAAKYRGPLKAFKRSGNGSLFLPGGKCYVGGFDEGCRNGTVSGDC